MRITLKDPQTTLDILDTEAMTRYIRDHIQVITAHTEECRESAGVCISIVAPPFIQFFDAIHNRVAVSVDSDLQRGQRHPEGRDAFPAHRAPDSEALKACLRFPRLPGISTHSFRKFFATEIYKANGYNVALVQKLLQHSSTAVTQRYIGIQQKELETAIENHLYLDI